MKTKKAKKKLKRDKSSANAAIMVVIYIYSTCVGATGRLQAPCGLRDIMRP